MEITTDGFSTDVYNVSFTINNPIYLFICSNVLICKAIIVNRALLLFVDKASIIGQFRKK